MVRVKKSDAVEFEKVQKEREGYTHTPGHIATVTQHSRGTEEKSKPLKEELAGGIFPLKHKRGRTMASSSPGCQCSPDCHC